MTVATEVIVGPHKMDPQVCKLYQGILLLNHLINKVGSLPVLLQGDDKYLEPVLQELYNVGRVAIMKQRYVPTDLGRESLVKFMAQFTEFVKLYGVFKWYDTATKEFLYSSYYQSSESEYETLKNEMRDGWSRWEDLRIPVMVYKQMDPIQIVFMAQLDAGRFDTTTEGWQFDLVSGLVWDEIIDICNSALTWERLGEALGTGSDDQSVISDIITRGMQVMRDYFAQTEAIQAQQEAERLANIQAQQTAAQQQRVAQQTVVEYYVEPVPVVTTVIVVEEEYYFNPYYLGPVWYDPWWW